MMPDLINNVFLAPDDGGGSGDAGGGETAQAIAPAAASPEVNSPETDPFDNPESQTFPREYVERVRREAAAHRTEAKPFKDAFDGYQPEEVEALLGLVGNLSKDPKTAAQQMQQIIDNISEAFPEPEQTETEDVPLTMKQYEEMRKKEADDAALNTQLAAIDKKAKDLGYEPNTVEYINLLWRANNQTNYDLDKAHDAIKADRQKIIDDYIADKEREASGSTVLSGGSSAGEVSEPKDWDGAKASLRARLGAVVGQ